MKRYDTTQPLIASDFWNVVSNVKTGEYVSFVVTEDDEKFFDKKIDENMTSSWKFYENEKTEEPTVRRTDLSHCYLMSRSTNAITGKRMLKFRYSYWAEVWISEPIHEGTDFDFFAVKRISRSHKESVIHSCLFEKDTYYLPHHVDGRCVISPRAEDRRCVKSDETSDSTFRIVVERDDVSDSDDATKWCWCVGRSLSTDRVVITP